MFIEIENREKCHQQDELDQIKSKNRHFFYKLRCIIKIYLFEKPLKENVVTNVTCYIFVKIYFFNKQVLKRWISDINHTTLAISVLRAKSICNRQN